MDEGAAVNGTDSRDSLPETIVRQAWGGRAGDASAGKEVLGDHYA